jgi:putative ABC transport system substrate-binding protein
LVIQADPFFNSRVDQLVKLTAAQRLPAIAEWRGFPIAGGLLSYGTSLTAAYRQDRRVRGQNPEWRKTGRVTDAAANDLRVGN